MPDPPFDPDGAALPDAGIFGLPHSPDEAAVVLIPVPWDATASYRAGASRGPSAILVASHQVDLCDVETGEPWRAGIALLPEPTEIGAWNREARVAAEPVIAAGGATAMQPDLAAACARVDTLSEAMNARVRSEADRWLEAGKLVGVVGGDHAAPFGAIQAVAARNPGLGVLHVDAHADLRQAYEGFRWSHASIMANVLDRVAGVARLVQVGVRDLGHAERARIQGSAGRVVTHFAAHLAGARFGGRTWASLSDEIVAALPRDVYLSFDIDGLDPSLCPHTGTPVPGGLTFAEACHLLATVARSGRRIVAFDLCEVAPGPPGDDWDGNVGARLLYQLVGWALRSRSNA